ncbi:MAG: phosphatidate cytidylyltransferase [Cellvibrionaceae bacterium]|nr:phosphatidate cytidylyltransferase [Cellvibrionaceae bacterium]
MLKQRIVTALLLVAVFLLSLFGLGGQGFIVFISALVLLGAWEWADLAGYGQVYQRLIYSLSTLVLTVLLSLYSGFFYTQTLAETSVLTTLLIAVSWWLVALLWVQAYPSSALLWGSRWARALIGWLVLIPGWLALIYLYQMPQGAWLIIIMVLTVFAADTGAYIFGRLFGRHKLAVAVSPGKSWEGFVGGLFCTLLLILLVAWQTDFASVFVLSAIILPTALASVLGDLLESMVKRHRGVKDSGHILPGHGGVLDRLDSLTAAAPVFALGIILSAWGF